MNRILFEKSEIVDGLATFGGERAEHVLSFLHGEVGQALKTGEVDGPIGTSVIERIDGRTVTVRVSHGEPSLAPWCDLVLAPPRPRAMKRLMPQLATLGAGRIFLVGAKKVEKDFWGATLLNESEYRPLFLAGLMQAGTTAMPVVETRRNFRKFVNEELDALFPGSHRVVAHPYGEGGPRQKSEMPRGRPLLAVGPEGGWTDEEVELLESKGFERISLGPRILKTETAVVGLLVMLGARNEKMV